MGVAVDDTDKKILLAKDLLDPRFNNVTFLLNKRKFEQAHEELDQMTAEDPSCVDLSLDLYRRLFAEYAEINQVDRMERLMAVMEKLYPPRLKEYKLLMHAQIRAKRPEEATKTFTKSFQLHPDMEMYNTLLKGLLKCNEKEKAYHVLAHTLSNLEPNKFTYCVLIDAAVKSEAMDQALVLLRYMTEDKVKPEAGIHTILMEWYCKKGNTRVAEEILRMMYAGEDRQYLPTHVTYGVLMAGYVRAGDMENAERIIDRIKQARQPLNSMHFATLMSANLDNSTYVVNKFAQMRDEGVVPTAICYTCLIRSMTRGSDMLPIIPKIFQHMKDNDVLPDVELFEAAMQAHLDHHDFEAAWGIFRTMTGQGYAALPRVFKNFILAYGSAGDLGEVQNILTKMDELKVEPDIMIWNSLLEAHYMCLDLVTPEDSVRLVRYIISRLQTQGLSMNVFTYNHVFRILGRLRQDQELQYWRTHMEQNNVAANEETRNILTMAASYNGQNDGSNAGEVFDPYQWSSRGRRKT